MNLKTLKCLSLLAVGFGFSVGCGGAPTDESLPGEDAVPSEGTVSAQACPIDGCPGPGDDEEPITLSLKCVANYPFVGLEITNTSTTVSVPADATITATVKYGYHAAVKRTLAGPLAKGQTKILWVDPIGSDYPLSCTASALWYKL
ncbi:hypothetical protein F0U60_14580 [Archangium minus]|uniref:Lipoprotein n=1 Tax=Archangium minus TaxID=83450 RepID=A0ABY9WN10_9BACT|nr:hypothetical protein F0U61_14670 [Archangium violaceum]WNG45196.1 hypothetical protein F0U60_14580 [Archangium minus]